eukprot:4016152-Amphidinium_carterae.1
MWNGAVVSYGSAKQKLFSLSSCESEVHGAVDTWLHANEAKAFLEELGIIDQPILLFTDNQASLSNASTGWRNRHFSMMSRKLNEEVAEGRLVWSWLPGTLQIGDGFTKVLPKDKLYQFRQEIGLC